MRRECYVIILIIMNICEKFIEIFEHFSLRFCPEQGDVRRFSTCWESPDGESVHS